MAELLEISTADLGLEPSAERGMIEAVDVDGNPVENLTAGGLALAERITFDTDDEGQASVTLALTSELDRSGVFWRATIGRRWSKIFEFTEAANLVDCASPIPDSPLGAVQTLGGIGNVDPAVDTAPVGKILGTTATGEWGAIDPTGGPGGGTVETVVAGAGISVDDTDPENPVVTAEVTQAELDAKASISAMANQYDLMTQVGGFAAGISRADLAADPAFADAFDAAGSAGLAIFGHVDDGDPHEDRLWSDAQLANHAADTTNVHGITDTSALATSSSVTSAVAAEASARSTADSTHAALTTTAHGIPTQIDAKVATHAAASDPHGDRAYTDARVGRFDVRAYGAVGDGSTDDRAAIQAAIDACSAAGGGVVFLPKGTFLIRRPLFLASRVTLQGSGRGVTTITKPASVKSVLTANASALATSVTVTDSTGFTVGGAIHLSDTTSYEWASTQGRITGIAGNVITFVNDEGLGRTGLDGLLQTAWSATAYSSFPLLRNVKASTKIQVRDLTLDQAANANDPTPTSSSVNGVTDFTIATIHWVETYLTVVENCELLNASGDAYSDQAQDGTGVTPAANIIIETRNEIRGCRINAATRHGVHVGTCNDGAIVTGNVITGCGWYGYFYCAYATNGIASGNIIDQCGSGFAGGDNRDTGNVITGNVIKDCTSWAVSFSDGAAGGTLPFQITIANNIIQASGAGKGLLIDCPDAVISGNRIALGTGSVDFCKITLNADRCNITGNVITQATGASGSRGIELTAVDDVRVVGNQIRGMQNAIAINGCARAVISANGITGTTARDIQLHTAASTDCRIDDHQGTRAVAYDEDVAPVRLTYNGLGSNGSADPASSGDWNAVTGKRWNGSMVRWNSGGGEKVSIFFQGVGWTALN